MGRWTVQEKPETSDRTMDPVGWKTWLRAKSRTKQGQNQRQKQGQDQKRCRATGLADIAVLSWTPELNLYSARSTRQVLEC